MTTTSLRLASTLLLVLVAGCGSTTTPPPGNSLGALDCTPLVACGGKLEGTWVLRGQCGIPVACAGAIYDYSKSNVVLTVTGSKLAYTGAGRASAAIPLSCWAQDAGGTVGDCGALNSRAGYTCSEGASACSCAIDFSRVYEGVPPASFILSGTQFLVGNVTYSYCVFGNVLRVAVDTQGADLGPVFEYERR